MKTVENNKETAEILKREKGWITAKLAKLMFNVGKLKFPCVYDEFTTGKLYAWVPVQCLIYENVSKVSMFILETKNGKIYNSKKYKKVSYGILVIFDKKE